MRQAKSCFKPPEETGVILVAGVHSCKVIAEQKGPPVMTDRERTALVKACKFVDEVVSFRQLQLSPIASSLVELNIPVLIMILREDQYGGFKRSSDLPTLFFCDGPALQLSLTSLWLRLSTHRTLLR